MRLSTDEDRDKELALETIAAASEAGITVFDTAHAYGRDEAELGHAADPCASSRRLSTNTCHRAFVGSSSTTRTSRVPLGAT